MRRLRQLDYQVTRSLVVGGATALLGAIALLAWARGVDPAEAVGVALYMPVFLAAVLLGTGEGIAAALLAGGAYVLLRIPAIRVVGFSRLAGLLATRAGSYLLFGAVMGMAASRLNASLSQSVGKGDIETHFVPGGNASGDTTLAHFPQLKTTLSIAQLGLDRAVRDNLDFALRYWFEKWDEDNFASDFSQPYMGDPGNDAGSKEAIFLGLDFANYTNHILSFLLRYRF